MATAVTPTALVYSNASLSIGDNTIFAGVVGKRIYVTQVSVDTSVAVKLQDASKTVTVISVDKAGIAGGTNTAILPVGQGLIATATSAGTASGYVMGFVV